MWRHHGSPAEKPSLASIGRSWTGACENRGTARGAPSTPECGSAQSTPRTTAEFSSELCGTEFARRDSCRSDASVSAAAGSGACSVGGAAGGGLGPARAPPAGAPGATAGQETSRSEPRRTVEAHQEVLGEASGSAVTGGLGAGGVSGAVGKMLKPARTPFKDVKLKRLVGQGSFGKVYMAQWVGSIVAVKVIEWKGARGEAELSLEAELSCGLSHPNLVQTFKHSSRKLEENDGESAVADGSATYLTWIVQEWCDAGTLASLCSRPRSDHAGHIEVIQICIDIASAVSYLHSRGIIHGDLSASNVLCQTQASAKGYVCKVCDFGLARVSGGEDEGVWTKSFGTITHVPPERFAAGALARLTPKADVYAFGVLLWQAVCGESPWKGLAAHVVVLSVMQGRRLQLPKETPECFGHIFAGCTADGPDARPSMDELARVFCDLLEQHSEDPPSPSLEEGDDDE